MGYPIVLHEPLDEYGYYMENDTAKQYCTRGEAPHWHLCKNGRRIGQISASGVWADRPYDVNSSIIREAERITSRMSSRITEAYYYNAENGADSQ